MSGIFLKDSVQKDHSVMFDKVYESLFVEVISSDNKKYLNPRSLKILYYSLIHCYLIYGIQVWSCAPNFIINDLFKKQKIAIRLLSNSKYNAHTEPLFKTFDILPLPSLIQYFKLQFMQQFQQKFLPEIFHETWLYSIIM